MKTSHSNETPLNGSTKSNNKNASLKESTQPNNDTTIALDKDDDIDSQEANYKSVKLTLPVTIGSTTHMYEKYIVRFDQGTPKRWLSFLKEFKEVKTQLELTTGPDLYSNFRTLLTGDALEKWNSVVTNNGTQTAPHFNNCVNDMTTYVFPENALSLQQTYLSSHAKKPSTMTWRQYDVKLHQENNNLAFYPPNFNNNQKLPDAVILGMVHRTVPNYFKEQVKTQGFDIQAKTTKELIQFFETRWEFVYRARLATQKRRDNPIGTIPRKKNNKRAAKWCTHCKNGTHDTGDCGYLIRRRAAQQKKAHDDSKKGLYKSKSMNAKDIKEFHAFNKRYQRWQAHKKKQNNDNHNVEINDDPIEEEPVDDDNDANLDLNDLDDVDDLDGLESVDDDISL